MKIIKCFLMWLRTETTISCLAAVVIVTQGFQAMGSYPGYTVREQVVIDEYGTKLRLHYYIFCSPTGLPLEPQRAITRGLLLLSSSRRQALPARSLMTDSSFKIRAWRQTNTRKSSEMLRLLTYRCGQKFWYHYKKQNNNNKNWNKLRLTKAPPYNFH